MRDYKSELGLKTLTILFTYRLTKVNMPYWLVKEETVE